MRLVIWDAIVPIITSLSCNAYLVEGIKHDCVCIVGVKLPRVLSRRAGRSRWRSPRLWHDATILSTATNILLIKSNLKFESRATAVSVAVSLRYLGGKFRSCLHPVVKKRVPVFAGDWACEIKLRQTGVICFPWRQRSWSCGVFKSWISFAHCSFQSK